MQVPSHGEWSQHRAAVAWSLEVVPSPGGVRAVAWCSLEAVPSPGLIAWRSWQAVDSPGRGGRRHQVSTAAASCAWGGDYLGRGHLLQRVSRGRVAVRAVNVAMEEGRARGWGSGNEGICSG